ncbi:protein draper-like [Bolinopsis microptera]|uniref:protein draper-like n=1 Tax=Bolinopsis microptera TaxID=2820187 RepID=UPI00307AB7F7
METDVSVIRYCLLFIFSLFPHCVNCDGTLYVKLERYQNDTCGGYAALDNTCHYIISLSVESYFFRGSDLIQKADHYQLSDDGRQFSLKRNQTEIKFSDYDTTFGPVPNPFPIKMVEGTINFTLAVNNPETRIFNKTFPFNTDTIKPNSVDQFYKDYSTGTLAFSTSLQCDPSFTGTGCKDCEDGLYGKKCAVKCTQNLNYTCHPDTGRKVCKESHYGEDCERYCKDTARYTCTDHGNKLCKYPAVGGDCEKNTTCAENQYGAACNMTCHPVPGQFLCGEDGTRVCEEPFTGPNCSSCSDDHYGVNCNITCVPQTSRYTCSSTGARVCGAGWKGEECAHCEDMWFGGQCQVFCNTSSPHYTCTIQGNRICTGNRVGKQCDSCQTDFYGDDCQVSCEKNRYWTCNKLTGEKICKEKHWSVDSCKSCNKDWYPCTYCAETDKYTCTNKGEKLCKSTWYGEDCNIYCKETQRYTCLDSGGIQCKRNYTGEENMCSSCIDNHYGTSCEVSCLETLFKECDPLTGAVRCKPGRYGLPTCSKSCNISSPLYTCTEHGDKDCKGNRDVSTECETCLVNWYGAECNVHCVTDHPNKHCSNNGSLLCKQGWAGRECLECDAHWYGHTCNEEEWFSRTCRKTCDTYCEDLVAYKCNGDGVLEMSAEFADEWLQERDPYRYWKVFLIIATTIFVYALATFLMYKIAFCWCPYSETK